MAIVQNIFLAVDAVVLGYTPEAGLSLLLIKRKYGPYEEMWALPGGFVKDGESLEEAVSRELEEETGVKIEYMEQLYTFGKPDRDPRRRVVSVAYYALVRPQTYKLHATTDAKDAQWFPIDKLPDLAFDHKQILEIGLGRVRNKLTYEPIGFNLLGEKFAFADLLNLYRAFLGDDEKSNPKLDRANFKKKLKKLGILEELPESRKQPGSGRPARLYRFNKENYFERKNSGVFETLFPIRNK